MRVTSHPWLLLVPATLVLAATLEAFWLRRHEGHYDWRAYFSSLADLVLRSANGLLPLGLAAATFEWLFAHRLYSMPLGRPWPWLLLILAQDFCYYWMHRADHRVRLLWAIHSVHHSPNQLNLSAAYRLGWTNRLSLAPLFFAPLVLFGYPPLVVGAALALNLFYQFWLHATWIPRLGALEWILNTPTHHRVHHASNPEYLDANFGGVLIVFDRLFGTFAAERPGIVMRYGLVEPIRSYNPFVIGLSGWIAIGRALMAARSWRSVWQAVLGAP
jgi:sterol desaturase/sphingolipid hydroxylase (fatty acid hydroxylase superfamily)